MNTIVRAGAASAISTLIMFNSLLEAQHQPTLEAFREIMATEVGQEKFTSFLTQIKVDIDPQLLEPIEKILTDSTVTTDREFFARLMPAVKANDLGKTETIRALWREQSEVDAMVAELIVASNLLETRKIKGFVEIDLPGRHLRGIAKELGKRGISVTGPRYVVAKNEPGGTDRIQTATWASGPTLAHDTYHPLGDYDPVSLAPISVDLIHLPAGLHHATEDQLADFVPSLHRALNDDGIVVLRDHDAKDSLTASLATAAHTMVNAWEGNATEEFTELRNFQPKEYWIELFSRHGFEYVEIAGKNCRDGDPTLNSFYVFGKTDAVAQFKRTFGINRGESHRTTLADQYLNVAEWHNVDAPKDYADFLKQRKFFEYPYISQTLTFWRVYADSWQDAKGQGDFGQSETLGMNTVLGVFSTMENLSKSAASIAPFLLWSVVGGPPDSDLDRMLASPQLVYADVQDAYAEFIPDTPFIYYPYDTDRPKYTEALLDAWNRARASGASRFTIVRNPHFLLSLYTWFVLAAESGTKSVLTSAIKQVTPEDNLFASILIQDIDGALKYLKSERGYHFKTAVEMLMNDQTVPVEELIAKHHRPAAEGDYHSLDLQVVFAAPTSGAVVGERRILELSGHKEVRVKVRAARELEPSEVEHARLHRTIDMGRGNDVFWIMNVKVDDLFGFIYEIENHPQLRLDFVFFSSQDLPSK